MNPQNLNIHQPTENIVMSADFYNWAGIDHISSPFVIRDNKLAQCINFVSTGVVGGKTTRPPYSLFLDQADSSKVRNLIYFVYQNSDGTSTGYIIRASGANLYKYQVGSGASSWTALTGFTPTDTTTPFAHATLANRLHLSNGTDQYQTWVPSTFTSSSTAPKVRWLTTFQRRIFGGNAPGATSRVYFSSVDYTQITGESSTDPWFSNNLDPSTSNYFDVDSEHNGAVTAADVVNSNLVMHKGLGALYLYNGTSISNPLQAQNPYFNTPGSSSASPYAIDQISGIEFFLDNHGIYSYQGSYPNLISQEVYDFIQNTPNSVRQSAPAITFNYKYYVALGTITDSLGYTVNNCVLVYDYLLNIWETYSVADLPTCWCTYVDSNGNEQLLFGDANGKVYKWNTGTGDNSAAQTALLETHFLTFGAPDVTKEISEYTLNTNPGANFQFQYALDWNRKRWYTLTNTSGYGVSDTAPTTLRNFKSVAFRLVANTTVPCTFYGFTVKVGLGTRRNSGRRL